MISSIYIIEALLLLSGALNSNVFVIFQRSSDFMISVTYFALVNLAMSKVDVHQDQGDQYEDGQ